MYTYIFKYIYTQCKVTMLNAHVEYLYSYLSFVGNVNNVHRNKHSLPIH